MKLGSLLAIGLMLALCAEGDAGSKAGKTSGGVRMKTPLLMYLDYLTLTFHCLSTFFLSYSLQKTGKSGSTGGKSGKSSAPTVSAAPTVSTTISVSDITILYRCQIQSTI